MIIPHTLKNRDIPAVLNYIAPERGSQSFIEGDIESYGLEGDIVTMYSFGDEWDYLVLRTMRTI